MRTIDTKEIESFALSPTHPSGEVGGGGQPEVLGMSSDDPCLRFQHHLSELSEDVQTQYPDSNGDFHCHILSLI